MNRSEKNNQINVTKVNRPVQITLISWVLLSTILTAQSQLLPLDHQVNNKLGLSLYSIDHPTHTSIHPFELRDITSGKNIDSLIGGEGILHSPDESWINRKLFHEHLIDITGDDYRIYGDITADLHLGKDFQDNRNTFVNTRGFIFGGSVNDDFSFYTEFFENQSIFPRYLDSFIRKNSVVPGQGFERSYAANMFDYAYSSAVISYRPSQYISFQGGHGKNFIGDGYRSLLLSDASFNYPYAKITADIWKLKYMILWTEFQDISSLKYEDRFSWPKKSGVFHYLDVRLTDRFTLGFFEGIIWLPQDSIVNRGIEWNYLNPIIFLRPVEFSLGSPDNVVMGLNASYRISNSTVTYGQILIDELTINEYFANKGYWANKYGIQLGVKSFNVLDVPGLFIQNEINLASPYTYSHKDPLKNYGHYNQSLAHPLGANFYEGIGIVEYSKNRYECRLQLNYSIFGADSSSQNSVGQNIYQSYDHRTTDYGNYIGQGIKTNLLYADIKVAYVVNPLTNLRFEASCTYRSLTSTIESSKTFWVNIGVRSSFRNLYYDF